MDPEILSRYTIDPPEEEDACESADGNPAARTVQAEGEQIIRPLPRFFWICCNPHQICRNFMSSSMMKRMMGTWLPGLYRTKVCLFVFLPFFLPDSPDSPHLPEIYVEFTDEDEETGMFTSDLFFMLY